MEPTARDRERAKVLDSVWFWHPGTDQIAQALADERERAAHPDTPENAAWCRGVNMPYTRRGR